MIFLQLLGGLALLVAGANFLTDGAISVARRFNVSEFMIGLTIVAVGTSMPEMVVSVMSAFEGKSDMAIGNIVGSNIFNVFFILGITTLIIPLPLSRTNIRRDIPLSLGASLVLVLLAYGQIWGGAEVRLSRIDGVVMLLLYAAFTWYMIRQTRKEVVLQPEETPKNKTATDGIKTRSMWLVWLIIAASLGALIFGASLLLDGSVALARHLGVKESTIALVLVAGGTSLPELAASFAAAVKGSPGIALGNILGSNIANILLILGLCATIIPLNLGNITVVDLGVMVLTSIVVFASAYTFKRGAIGRWEGAIYLMIYAAYLVWLF